LRTANSLEQRKWLPWNVPLSPSPADQLSAGAAGEAAILTDYVTAKDVIRKA